MVCEELGCSRRTAETALEALFAVIKQTLCRGQTVKVSGFGSFVVERTRERRGRNPQTGRAMVIQARKALVFKPSPVLKHKVQNGAKTPLV